MARLLIALLVAAIYSQSLLAAMDFCNAEPRLNIKQFDCPNSNFGSNVLVYQRPLDGNPNHAVHDYLWAVTYYLRFCLVHQKITLGIVSKSLPTVECQTKGTAPWGECALSAVARAVKADIVPLDMLTRTHKCFNREVEMNFTGTVDDGLGPRAKNFRRMSWYGRVCVGTLSCISGNSTFSQLVPLPFSRKKQTFSFFRDAVREFVGLVPIEHYQSSSNIKILLYNRGDAHRRVWINSDELTRQLLADDRVEVRAVINTPISFSEQVEMYAWADIVVAPHGAAMVNTIFLNPGSEIIEIFRTCQKNINTQRYIPQDWTGWHASFLDLHIQYSDCVDITNMSLYKKDVNISNPADVTSFHEVRIQDIMPLLETAVNRQKLRRTVARLHFKFSDPVMLFSKVMQIVKHSSLVPYKVHYFISIVVAYMVILFTKKQIMYKLHK